MLPLCLTLFPVKSCFLGWSFLILPSCFTLFHVKLCFLGRSVLVLALCFMLLHVKSVFPWCHEAPALRIAFRPRSPSFKDCLSPHLVVPFWRVLLLHPSGCFFQNENFLRIFLRSLKLFLSGTSFLLLHPRAFCTKAL